MTCLTKDSFIVKQIRSAKASITRNNLSEDLLQQGIREILERLGKYLTDPTQREAKASLLGALNLWYYRFTDSDLDIRPNERIELVPSKPKTRTRRTKAQMEAEKLASRIPDPSLEVKPKGNEPLLPSFDSLLDDTKGKKVSLAAIQRGELKDD